VLRIVNEKDIVTIIGELSDETYNERTTFGSQDNRKYISSNIIIVLAPGDKGLFEKYRNAFFSDFDANWRKISKFEKKLCLEFYLPF